MSFNNKPKIYIIQGFIASGKTTYSKKLANETGSIRLNGDECCEDNFSEEELNKDWDNLYSIAITKLYKKAEKLIKNGNDVILDFGFWSKKSRDYVRQFASDNNAELIHLLMGTEEQEIINRMKKRSGAIAENNIKNFKELKKYFEKKAINQI